MLDLARGGVAEGLWLRAERQTGGRGRQGRAWDSPVGNLYASTTVRLRPADPAAATLALVAAVAVAEALLVYHPGEEYPSKYRFDETQGRGPVSVTTVTECSAYPRASSQRGPGIRRGRLEIKWPNDLLIDGAKLSGILLERADDAVVIGIGINLAYHPDLPDRLVTSLAAYGPTVAPGQFIETLAEAFARWLSRWRGEGLAPIRQRWLDLAHPIGTALTARLPDGSRHDGLFDGLDADGALVLRLADGTRRVIHAADVFVI